MTHVEFLKKLIADYEKEFAEEPSINEEGEAFRRGMIFAWKLAIELLKDPNFE